MKGNLLAKGAASEVFEWGDSRVLKLYKNPEHKLVAFREALIHGVVQHSGLPVPHVWGVQQIEDRWGVIFERVPNSHIFDLDRIAQLHIAIHRHVISGWDKPIFMSLKTRLSGRCKDANLLAGLAAMEGSNSLCHGDFHPWNILAGTDKPLVIDWIYANRGDPAADVCRSYLCLGGYGNDRATSYVKTYCRLSGISQQAVFDWLPYISLL